MAKGLPRSLARGSKAVAPIIKQHVKIDTSIDLTGVTDTAVGGTAVIGDFPQGNIMFLGAVAYVQTDATGDTHVIDNYNGDYAIGTVPTADNDVGDAGEANIIPSTALDAGASDKISAIARGVQADGALAGVVFDNTDGSLEINLNLLMDANVVTNAQVGSFTCTGDLYLAYIVLGDD